MERIFTDIQIEKDILVVRRYCYSIDYIKSLCKKFDYDVFSESTLRKDNLKDVVGGVYLFLKNILNNQF